MDVSDKHSVTCRFRRLTMVLAETVDEAADLVLLQVEVLHRFEVIQGASCALVVAELLSHFDIQHLCLPYKESPGYQEVEDHSAQKDGAVVRGSSKIKTTRISIASMKGRDHLEEEYAGLQFRILKRLW